MDPNASNTPQSDTDTTATDDTQQTPTDTTDSQSESLLTDTPSQNDTNATTTTDDTQQTPTDTSDTQSVTPAADTSSTDTLSDISSPEQSVPVSTDTATTPDQDKENYIENVGGGEIGLLDEISAKDELLQQVADEMQLDKEKVKTILTTLLDKIDKGQISSEEIALILASTVADDLTSDEDIY